MITLGKVRCDARLRLISMQKEVATEGTKEVQDKYGTSYIQTIIILSVL